jgi:hypothetical protein
MDCYKEMEAIRMIKNGYFSTDIAFGLQVPVTEVLDIKEELEKEI